MGRTNFDAFIATFGPNNNALKHAFTPEGGGKIEVTLKEIDDTLIVKVEDNGRGIDTDKIESIGNTFGYRLIEAFKTKLDAMIEVEGKNGTSVKLSIKDYQKVA